MVRASRRQIRHYAGSRRPEVVGGRAALGGDPVGYDAFARDGFPSCEPRRSGEQYSRRDFDGLHRAARLSCAVATFAWARLASLLTKALGFCTGMLLAVVEWFSRLPHVSYRIPGPPTWLWLGFFAAFVALAVTARAAAARRANRIARRQLSPPIALASGRPRSRSPRSRCWLPRIRFARISIGASSRLACSTSARAIRSSPRFPAAAPC